MKKGLLIIGILALLIGLANWRGGSVFFAKKEATSYQLQEPALFFKMTHPEDNQLTEEGVELGRHLFYDPMLSLDSTISCSSCHLQALAFTDGKAFSLGINGRKGKRSAPSLVNIGYHYKGLFWDSRSPSLEEQAIHPIEDSLEMGNSWPVVVKRLQEHPSYPKMFKAAFGIKKEEISKDWVTRALSQFQRTIISADSKYDRVLDGTARFTEEEQRGMTIFFDASEELPFSECGHCHTDPLFTDLSFENNGIDSDDDPERDKGKGALSGQAFDDGQFKVPTLRNIALTAPYMHDGRFQSLEEVVDHYTSGGHPGPNVSPNVRPLTLSEKDKQALIAFLNTLTDSTLLNREDLSNPF
jgi:cytochrome c peroxidase